MQTVDKETPAQNFYEDYTQEIVYDPDVSLKALRPEHIMEIITNPYYFKATTRFLQVFSVFIKILLDYWYDKQKWTYFKQWISTGNIEKAESLRRTKRAIWLRETLLNLGPTFIKIGQALSTRADLLRREYILELAKLQDKVPAFSLNIVEKTIEEELGHPISWFYESFNKTPLAAASLGQVHRARLFTGEEVVIKIQRPHLIEIFNLDIAILKKVARFCRKFLPFAKDRNWPEIVDEFGKTLFEEIDYILEAKNVDTFKENFRNEPQIYIPKVYWKLITRRVLTMEYKPGIKIDNIKAIDDLGFDREELSIVCLQAYLKQFLNDGIYHADPHPGNLAIDRITGQIIFYDFGMVGKIEQKTKIKMLSAFLNVVNRRADALLKDIIDLHMIDKEAADLDKIRGLIQWSFDNYYDVPYEEVRFEEITDELADIMYAFPFRLPSSFTFIVRAIVTLEGLCIKLNPKINFMEVAVPFARKYISKQDMFEFFRTTELKELYKLVLNKISDIFDIDILPRSRNHKNINVKLDTEDMEILRRQMINGFGIIGLGIIISLVFIMLTILVVTMKNMIMAGILIGTIAIVIPLYFGVLLAVLLNRPTRPKELLRRHLEQRNKFDTY